MNAEVFTCHQTFMFLWFGKMLASELLFGDSLVWKVRASVDWCGQVLFRVG